MKKIVAITSDNRSLNFKKKTYLELSYIINSNYFKKNNIKFYFVKLKSFLPRGNLTFKNSINSYSTKCLSPRAPSWSKLLAIIKVLKLKYDYIIYMDSDCIINNHEVQLKNIINQIGKKKFLFYSDSPWNKKLPNCGFIIIKNSEYSKKFLEKWWNSFSLNAVSHPYEQKWFQNFWLKKRHEVKTNFKLIEKTICRLKSKKQFIFHVTSDLHKKREVFFENFIKKNKIKKRIIKKTIQLNTIIEDRKINKRKLYFFDYIVIFLAYRYLEFKNYLTNFKIK